VSMALVIIGESANSLSETALLETPEVDWRSIVGLRNRIAHGYGSVDQRLVWSIAVKHAPSLAGSVEKLRGLLGD
jgi:uncharacterized protein with HEPN domain